jgi:hypothetical protein
LLERDVIELLAGSEPADSLSELERVETASSIYA